MIIFHVQANFSWDIKMISKDFGTDINIREAEYHVNMRLSILEQPPDSAQWISYASTLNMYKKSPPDSSQLPDSFLDARDLPLHSVHAEGKLRIGEVSNHPERSIDFQRIDWNSQCHPTVFLSCHSITAPSHASCRSDSLLTS